MGEYPRDIAKPTTRRGTQRDVAPADRDPDILLQARSIRAKSGWRHIYGPIDLDRMGSVDKLYLPPIVV